MKHLLHSLLCSLFIHIFDYDFETLSSSPGITDVTCSRCSKRWSVDLHKRTMTPVAKGKHG